MQLSTSRRPSFAPRRLSRRRKNRLPPDEGGGRNRIRQTVAIFDPSAEMAAAARRADPPRLRVTRSSTARPRTRRHRDRLAERAPRRPDRSWHWTGRGVFLPEARSAARATRPRGGRNRPARRQAFERRSLYRYTDAMRQIRDLIASGELGTRVRADLTFHNAYGPSKPWFYDKALSRARCVIDLGVHLVTSFSGSSGSRTSPAWKAGSSPKSAIRRDGDEVEDYAVATGRNCGTALSPRSHAHCICRPDAMR